MWGMTTPTVCIHTRIPCIVRDHLKDHAEDLGRTMAVEIVLWLEAAAAMNAYAAMVDPRATMYITDPEELVRLRAEALDTLREALGRALPTPVAPDAVLASLGTPSMN
jgi:hypothetical protein